MATLEEFNAKKAGTNGQTSEPVLSPRGGPRPKTEAQTMRSKKKVIREHNFKITSNPNAFMNSNKLYTNMLLRRSALHNNNEKRLNSADSVGDVAPRQETLANEKVEEPMNMPVSRSFDFKKGSLKKLMDGSSRNH
jgi:hypothetical protein